MTAAALTPRVRVMVVCDGIKPSQVEEDVFHLRGVRYYVAAAGGLSNAGKKS
jgi:hypothetical protein